MPALDGLRFYAFLLVYCHHAAAFIGPDALLLPASRGWLGVEIFFALSSCLFFYLFSSEMRQNGSIDIGRFYVRRFLRIYPLMMAFPIAALLIFGGFGTQTWARLIGLSAFVENFMIWREAAYSPIPFAAHLWTLSYEFQIYLVMPLAFLLYAAVGLRIFLLILAAVWIVSLSARGAFVLAGAEHPIIWVTPFLRPDSTIVGILIALGVFSRLPAGLVLGALGAGLAVLLTLPNVAEIGPSTMAIYPAAALAAGALLWLAFERGEAIGPLLVSRPVVFLGQISFGLYVYHVVAIALVLEHLDGLGDLPQFVAALTLTIALATASYYLLERPFLTLKSRFSPLPGSGQLVANDSSRS